MLSNNNIVVVGGGFAGVSACTELEKALAKANDTTHRIILIETKSHFYHAIAGPRAAVIDIDDQIMIPYSNLFKNKQHIVIQASAIQFEKNHIVLDRSVPEFGTTIPFKNLVLATGTSYAVPSKASTADYNTAHETLVDLRSKIKTANSILIVGGGPVGLEIAGEIQEHYPKKHITIVHDKENVMDERSAAPNFRAKLLALLEKNKIETYFNETVVLPQDLKQSFYETSVVETRSGKKISTDLVLLAFGNRPQTTWLKNTDIGADIVNPNGYVKVKDTFQVDHPELQHVYVAGDAADLPETKMAFRIQGHIPVVVENLINGAVKQEKPTSQYKKGPDAMLVTFGSKQGATYLPLFGGLVLGSWISSTLKGKTLFIEKTWKSLNLQMPANGKQGTNGGYSAVTTTTSVLVIAAAVAYYYKYLY